MEEDNGLPEIPNAADDIYMEKQARAKRRADKKALDFWVSVFNDAVGRAEMWKLLAEMGTFKSEFPVTPAGFPDQNALFFRLGQAQFGRDLHDKFSSLSRGGVMKMHDEHDTRFTLNKGTKDNPR